MVGAAVASIVEDGAQAKIPNAPEAEISLLDQMNAAFADSFKVDGKPISKKK